MPNTRKILIVDDDPELRDALSEQLSLYEEFEAVAAEDGSRAVQAAKAGQIDLVIMDVGLPDIDGREAVRIARSTRRRALCGPHWLARRVREEAPQERAGAIRESSGSAWHDSISMAISPVPEGQCLGTVVPRPHRERPRHSQDHDRGRGAQASDRPVAARAGGRGARRRHSAPRTMTRRT